MVFIVVLECSSVLDFWSQRSVLSPNCIFAPTTSQNLADAVKILAQTNTKFNIRSGGHSPTAGTNSINDGVLIVTTHFNDTTIVRASENLTDPYFLMGADVTWDQAYDYLAPQNLTVVGGRVSAVGSSLVLGGGISYLGEENGWAANNVLNYELVTAQGEILQVNEKSHPDLFWALKGGLTNFGIVVRYSLKLIPQRPIWGGTIAYLPSSINDCLDAQQAFINPGGGLEDRNAAILTSYNYSPAANQTNATFVGIYNAPENNPRAFENFTTIANSSADVGVSNYNDFIRRSSVFLEVGEGVRGGWFTASMAISNDTMNFQYQTLIDTANRIVPGQEVIVGLASDPITPSFLQEAVENGGDAMDLDPSNGSFFVVLIYGIWFDAAQDAIMQEVLSTMAAELDAGSKKRGDYYPFLFPNYVGSTQDPFEFYGAGKSLPKLKQIARKYDPQGVFQRLVPGFKLDGPMTALPVDD